MIKLICWNLWKENSQIPLLLLMLNIINNQKTSDSVKFLTAPYPSFDLWRARVEYTCIMNISPHNNTSILSCYVLPQNHNLFPNNYVHCKLYTYFAEAALHSSKHFQQYLISMTKTVWIHDSLWREFIKLGLLKCDIWNKRDILHLD